MSAIDFCNCSCANTIPPDTTVNCSGHMVTKPGAVNVSFAGIDGSCLFASYTECPNMPGNYSGSYRFAAAPIANKTYVLTHRTPNADDACNWFYRAGHLTECDIVAINGIDISPCTTPCDPANYEDFLYQYVGQRTCSYPIDCGGGVTCTYNTTINAYLSLEATIELNPAVGGITVGLVCVRWLYAIVTTGGCDGIGGCTGTASRSLFYGTGMIFLPADGRWFYVGFPGPVGSCGQPFTGADAHCLDSFEACYHNLDLVLTNSYPYSGSFAVDCSNGSCGIITVSMAAH